MNRLQALKIAVTVNTSEFAVFSTLSEFGELTSIENLKEFFS
jgi:hypothetical protein